MSERALQIFLAAVVVLMLLAAPIGCHYQEKARHYYWQKQGWVD